LNVLIKPLFFLGNLLNHLKVHFFKGKNTLEEFKMRSAFLIEINVFESHLQFRFVF